LFLRGQMASIAPSPHTTFNTRVNETLLLSRSQNAHQASKLAIAQGTAEADIRLDFLQSGGRSPR
jgi:hypothetical protein